MRPGRSLSVRAINVEQHDGDEGRRAGRFRVGDVFFVWNRKRWRVLDLSATGLRLQLTGRLRFGKGDRIGVTLQLADANLPLLGTYSARVMIHRGFYSGVWYSLKNNYGVVLAGRILKRKDDPAPGKFQPGSARPKEEAGPKNE